jgi:antitoxin component YwqK of YwqJK toxin-antitoxin module
MNKMTKSYVSGGDNVLLEGCVKRKRFVPHGEVSITNNKGQKLLSGRYLNGRPDGKWVRWYQDGTLCSEHRYAFGLPVGTSKQYWANGKLARECKHHNGFYDYEEKIHNKKGREEKHKVYKKGRLANAKIKVGKKC